MSANAAGTAATQDRLAALLSPAVEEAGYDLEDLVLTPMGRRSLLRVVIDRDEGISLDDIAGISHTVAQVLDDDEGPMGKSPYVLEVTSPGVDRPLSEARHWRRATGRLVEVLVSDSALPDTVGAAHPGAGPGGAEARLVRGRVTGVDGTDVRLSVDGADHLLPLDALGPGKVQLEFNRPDEGVKREQQHSNRKKSHGKRASGTAIESAEVAAPTTTSTTTSTTTRKGRAS